MKLLLKQYLTSLNERGELDAILPDFLSESGFKVTYRAQRGNREYGVDVAAVGDDPKTGQTTLFLLSIKAGDLKRRDWDSGDQSLRASLNEIIDFYIPKRIPKHLKALPIKIALCFGGDIQGNIRDVVESYIDEHTQEGVIDFEEWNGDHIVGLIAGGILRESIFPKPTQTDLRKALAFVDEPSVCGAHFQRVLSQLESQNFKRKRDRLTATRQICLIVWNIYVWGRDANNLEAAYQCSERSLLWAWDMCKDHIGRKSAVAHEQTEAINKLANLVQTINNAYIIEHILPYSHALDGLSSSVASRFSLDINLKLFDVLGRVALNGIWFMSYRQQMPFDTSKEIKDQFDVQIEELAQLVLRMMSLNSVYNSPICDDHAIEITLVGIFLRASGHGQALAKWIEQIYCFSSLVKTMHFSARL